MCVHMVAFYSHIGSQRGGGTCYVVRFILKNTIIKRTILIERYTQIARGRGSAGYNIHERLRGQYLMTAKHVIIWCGRE